MNYLLDKLEFARSIGATHFYNKDFWKNDIDGKKVFWSLINKEWKSANCIPEALPVWSDCKIDFSPLDNKADELQKPDMVNNPPHYQTDNGIECIDAIRAALGLDGFVAYCRGNAIKYSWRAGKKSEHAEDLKKAEWYLDRAAQELYK